MKTESKIILAICLLSLTAFSGCKNKADFDTRPRLTYMVQSDKTYLPDSPFAKELCEKTGIDVKYIVAQPGNYYEHLNILKLSSSLPDIIESNWLDYNGGVNEAISDGYIIPLNDLLEEHSPNLAGYLKSHPEVNKQVITDDGIYYAYPFLRDDSSLNVYGGFIIRTDWLEESNLPVPETLADWERTLTVFRDKYKAESPIMMPANNHFKSAFGITEGFYVEDGRVKFGSAEQGYREYLETMNRWFNQGFFQPEFPSLHMQDTTITMQNGTCGALYGTAGNTMGTLIKAGTPVIGTPYPVKNKGDTPFSSQYDCQYTPNNAAAISPACTIPETAAKLLDFGYSEEGKLLYNFGIEGESYTLSGGYPLFTDTILRNESGLSIADAMNKYLRASTSAPCIQTSEYFNQYLSDERQKLSLRRWQQTDAQKHKLPPIYSTDKEFNSLKRTIEDYAKQTEIEFIIGLKNLDEFDSYVNTLYEKGLGDILSRYQEAYGRYLMK